MKIALVLGAYSSASMPVCEPEDLFTNVGLTGSESFYFRTVMGLASLGHNVTALYKPKTPRTNVECLSGARVATLDHLNQEKFDAVISWNETDCLKDVKPGTLRVVQQQLNDFNYARADRNDYTDVYVFPSRTSANRTCWNVPKDRIEVISNSTDLDFFKQEVPRDPFKMIWCSSPDRGLHRLLEMFPEIRERVPEAKLGIYYKFDAWCESAKNVWGDNQLQYSHGLRARYIRECLDRLGSHGENGVSLVGMIPNQQMARELLGATVLPYTCDPNNDFTEGYCVSILDACAAGCAPIISDVDAIGEVYQGVAEIIPGRPQAYKQKWIDTIVKALTDERYRSSIAKRGLEFAQQQSWQIRAKQWEKLLIERVK